MSRKVVFTAARRALPFAQLRRMRPQPPPQRRLVKVQLLDGGERVVETSTALDMVAHRIARFPE